MTTAGGGTGSGSAGYPFGDVVRSTLAAQERSLDLARSWTESVMGLMKDQAESSRAAMDALTSLLGAVEKALASQEESNRALRQSLETYRSVVEGAAAAQERTARLFQTALDAFASTTLANLEAAKALLTPPGAAAEPFGAFVREWNAAFQRMLGAAPPGSGERG